jgi:hypothetical protein
VPKLTETAKTGASTVGGQLDRLPRRHAETTPEHEHEHEHATVNGSSPH